MLAKTDACTMWRHDVAYSSAGRHRRVHNHTPVAFNQPECARVCASPACQLGSARWLENALERPAII